MNTTYIMATIIVPAETVETYRGIAEALSPSGAGMFQVPLYTGESITHYISTGKIWQAFVDIITDVDAFSAATGISSEEAQELQEGITYIAVGDVDMEGNQVLHNKEAIAHLGLSLQPSSSEEG